MKKIIYGETGTGKSYGPVADYIRNNTNIIIVTPFDINEQLSYAKLDKEIFEKNVIKIYDYSEILYVKQDKAFKNLLISKEFQVLANNTDNTVIIWSGFVYALNEKNVVHLLSGLNCNVLIEYCCSQRNIEYGELSLYFQLKTTWNMWYKTKPFDYIEPS